MEIVDPFDKVAIVDPAEGIVDPLDQKKASWWDTFKAIPGTVAGGLTKAAGGITQMIGENDFARQNALERSGDYDSSFSDTVDSFVAKKLGKTVEQFQQEREAARIANPTAKLGFEIADIGSLREKEAYPGEMSYWQRAALSGISSFVTQAPLIAASVRLKSATPAVAGASMLAGGSTHAENRLAGFSPDRSLAAAVIDAAAEGLLELLPTKFLIDNLDKLPITKLLFGTLIKEVPSEMLTTAVQSANAKLTTRPNMTWEEYGQDILDTIGSTMISVPLTGGIARGVSAAGRRAEEVNGVNNEPLIDPLNAPKAPPAPPAWEWPTAELNSQQVSEINALIASIDADLIKDTDVAAAEETVKKFREAQRAPVLPEAAEAWAVLDVDPRLNNSELGASDKQSANAANYVNPNADPRIERTFLFGPEQAVGLTPAQHLPQKATYTLGLPSADRSEEYLRAVHDTIERWRQRYMPNSTIVVSNEELPFANALGWHYSRNGVHVIVPAALRNMKSQNTFNANTQASAFFNLSHEFGHGIINDRFMEGIDPILQEAIRAEARQGIIREETLASLPLPQQAVLREYNFLKQQVLDGTMSAADFVSKWMGPGKAARKNILEGVDPLGPATNLLNRIARNAVKSAGIKDAVQADALRQQLFEDLLGIDEYLAEQTARYAYKAKWDQTSPLGQFFKSALESLRAFFTQQKRDGIIAPGTAFQDWIEGLTLGERIEEPAKQKALGKKAKAPAVQGTPAAAPKSKKPKVGRTQINVETSTREKKEAQGKELIGQLLESGKLGLDSPDAKKLLKLLKLQDYDEFIDLYKKYSDRPVKFELKPEGGNWEEKSIEILAEPIYQGNEPPRLYTPAGSLKEWSTKAVRKYLQRYAATEKDPLANIDIPFEDGTIKWLEAWKRSISAIPAWLQYNNDVANLENYPDEYPEIAKKTPPEEPVYRFLWSSQDSGTIDPRPNRYRYGDRPYFLPTGVDVHEAHVAQEAITDYLAHAHDYLIQNVPEQDLQRYDFVRLIRETAQWDKELAKKMKEKRAEEKTKSPILKEYPDGFYWQQLTQPGQFARESDAMGHSVRGYEPTLGAHPDWVPEAGVGGSQFYGLGGWEAIKEGRAQIYSLRDKEGNSHVTVEVNAEQYKQRIEGTNPPQYEDHKPSITQIKGKQNQAPAKQYLPYVQDFVRSQAWSKVQDIRNAGMAEVGEGYARDFPTAYARLQEQFPGQKYFTEEQLKAAERPGDLRRPQGNFDLDDPPEQQQFLKGIRNFISNLAGLRMALRRAQGIAFQVLEIQQLAHLNPDLENLQAFREFNTHYNSRKSSLQTMPDRLTDIWEKQGKENADKLSKVLLEEMEGGEHWFDLVKTTKVRNGVTQPWTEFRMSPRAMDELGKRGIDLTTDEGQVLAELLLDVKNNLLDLLNEKEQTFLGLIAQRHAEGGAEVMKAAMLPVMRKFNEYRKAPFFPQGRFGNLMLIIERHRPEGGYEVVYKEAFENREDWKKAWEIAEKNKKPDERVQAKELSEQTYVLMSLPLDFVDLAASELDLSPDEVEVLLNILQPVKSEKALKSYELARLGIKGYSSDALRSYANYTWHDANLIAKMEYRSKFGLAIRGIKKQLRQAQYAGPAFEQEVFRLTRVLDSMEKTRDYIMSPPNEAQMLRGIVSVGYLALNLKTALVNFAGLLTTWSDVSTRMGLVDGSAAMARATAKAFSTIRLTNLNEARQSKALTPEEQVALDRALEEGVLSQSYAYHLAGVANRSNLFRMPSAKLAQRFTKDAVDAAMWAFRLAELSTRRVTFLAEHELARKKGGQLDDAYQEAVNRTNILQNDFSLGNRVPFMRGGAFNLGPLMPLATIFMSFTQHMAFHTYGGYELGERRAAQLRGESPRNIAGGYTTKLWVALLILAGYEGLPGAENILDLLEAFWRKIGGQTPIRQQIREIVKSLDIPGLDPQRAAHGLGHNIGGFDLSRSIGFGRMVPGTDAIGRGDNIQEQTGALVLDIMGPLGGYIKFGLDAAFNKDASLETYSKIPGGIGNILSAYHWSQQGVRAPTGALVTFDLETGKPRDLTAGEIFGKALGFNPTIVSEGREIRWEQYDRKVYWTTRRKELLDDYWKATWQKDIEAKADVKKAISDYNAGIPQQHKSLRISGLDVQRSLQDRRRNMQRDQARLPSERRYESVYRDVLQSYDQEGSP